MANPVFSICLAILYGIAISGAMITGTHRWFYHKSAGGLFIVCGLGIAFVPLIGLI